MVRRKHVDPLAWLNALDRGRKAKTLIPKRDQDDIEMLAMVSLEAIRRRDGNAGHFGVIALACNMTCALIRQGIGTEATEIAERCQVALLNADNRFTKFKIWEFTKKEYEDVKALLDVHKRVIASASQLETERALADITDRLKRGDVLQRVAA